MLVLFDLDGTLLDLSMVAAVAREAVVRRLAIAIGAHPGEAEARLASEEASLRRARRRVPFFGTKVWPDEDPLILLNQAAARLIPMDAVVATYARVREACSSPPYPDALAALLSIRRAGHRVGVCTNTVRERAARDLAEAGIGPLVDALVAGDDPTWPLKGDPDEYRRRLRELRDAHGELLVAGDVASLDLEPARGEGLPTCLVVRPYTPERSLRLRWTVRVSSLGAVAALVASLGAAPARRGPSGRTGAGRREGRAPERRAGR